MKDEREPHEVDAGWPTAPERPTPYCGDGSPAEPAIAAGNDVASDTTPTEQLGPTPDSAGYAGPAPGPAYPWPASVAASPTTVPGHVASPPSAPWGDLQDDQEPATFPPVFADPYGAPTSAGSVASTTQRRRGPGWGGVTGLVALGMLVSSGVTLGGVITYEQVIEPRITPTSASTPATVTVASPASVSTIDDPNWTAIAAQVSPSAVAIQVRTAAGTSQGTGVILDQQGSILTNNHVVGEGDQIMVTTSDGLSYEASVVGTDPTTDLAVIRMGSPPDGLQPATFADSSQVAVGQPVMALGTPLGLENTVTTGIVSAVDRPVTASGEDPSGSDTTYTSAIQTDAAINPGNSGGPLIDAAGRVIGINTAIAGIPNSSGQAGSIGLGFAIPSNTASMIADQLQEDGTADHSYLGVTSLDGSKAIGDVAYRGAEVVSVESDSPAEEAGLRKDDLITAIDETPVGGAAALTGAVRGLAVGSDHTLTVVRDGAIKTLEITLTSRPS